MSTAITKKRSWPLTAALLAFPLAIGVWWLVREPPVPRFDHRGAAAPTRGADAAVRSPSPDAGREAQLSPREAEADADAGAVKLDSAVPGLREIAESNRLLQRAKGMLEKDPVGARATIDDALRLHPKNEDALELRARLFLDDEEYESATEMAERCLGVSSTNQTCLSFQLWSYTRSGRFKQAKPLLEACLERDPKSKDCGSGMVSVLLRSGNTEEAREAARHLESEHPGSTDAHLALGGVAEAAGDLEDARKNYEAACSKGQEFACRRAEEIRRGSD